MGIDRPGIVPEGRRRPVSRIVRVVPDVTTFAVDDGFSYIEPDDLSAPLGAIVRVPLASRIVRGWVIGVSDASREGLRSIRRVSGTLPVFGPKQLETHRWLAHHYVAPLASILRAATPPNLPTRVPRPPEPTATGRTRRDHVATIEDAMNLLGGATGGSLMVIAPTGVEVRRAAAAMAGRGDVVVVEPDASDRQVTAAWSRARLEEGLVLVGTGRVAMWWMRGLSTVVVLEEGRRSHKERQAPTLHPRTILSHRAAIEGLHMITTGTVPTLETLSTGTPFPHPRRLWPLVEVVNRNEEPPGRGVVSERVKQAIRHAVNQGRTTLVFSHRRGYAPAFRCTRCGQLRRCPACGSAATNAGICPRCGAAYGACAACSGRSFEPLGAAVGRVRDLMQTLVGAERVGDVGSSALVQVGTERDLVDATPVGLAVVLDGDRLLLGLDYRAPEDGLRLMARVAGLVAPGAGNRAMVQTSLPDHPAVAALRRGDPTGFLDAEMATRSAAGLPPAGELIVLETRGEQGLAPDDVVALEADGAMVFGPRETATGIRWLLQGRDLGTARMSLRKMVRRLRDSGSEVRVDVDPLEL